MERPMRVRPNSRASSLFVTRVAIMLTVATSTVGLGACAGLADTAYSPYEPYYPETLWPPFRPYDDGFYKFDHFHHFDRSFEEHPGGGQAGLGGRSFTHAAPTAPPSGVPGGLATSLPNPAPQPRGSPERSGGEEGN